MLPSMPDWPGVTWRPAEPADAARIVQLQDACFEVDDTYREVESEIRERFEDPETDAATDSMIGVLDDGLRLTYFNLAPKNASWIGQMRQG